MAQAAVKSSQKVAGTPVPTREVPKTLREMQVRKFPQSSMQIIGQDFSILTITAPADMSVDEALIPEAWVNVSRRVAMDSTNRRREWLGSLIHVHSATHAWFAIFYIRSIVYDKFKQPCGLQVACIGPSVDPKTGKACPINVATGLPWVDPKEDTEEAA